MAPRSLFAAATVCLIFAAAPASAASGDVAATGIYAFATHTETDAIGRLWVVVVCVDLYADSPLPNLDGGSCTFELGPGSYTIAVHDTVLGDVPFTYQVSTFGGDECGMEEGVTSATVTMTEDCSDLLVVPDPLVSTAGTVTIKEA